MRHSIAHPRWLKILLAKRQRRAGRDLDLRLDQIDSGHHFGHRMLDLDTRVHLEEIEIAIGVDQKLDRAGADIIDRCAALTATSPIARRISGVMKGDGDSSTTF